MANTKVKLKQNKLNKKKKQLVFSKELVLACFTILLGILVVFGTTYAVFTTIVRGTKEHTVIGGIFNVTFNEGSSITLNNAYPMSDTEGLKTDAYTFTIKNTGTVDAMYRIRLEEDLTDLKNKVPSSAIKVSYKKADGTYSTPQLVSTLLEGSVLTSDQTLTVNQEVSYEIKMWVAESASNDAMGKTFKSKIVVESVQKIDYAYSDTIVPVINLKGNRSITLAQNATFTDPGITSVVDTEGEVIPSDQVAITYEYYDGTTTSTVSRVDTTKLGVYYIYYRVSDSKGNVGAEVRTVNIYKPDTTPPTLKLNGPSSMVIKYNTTYQEPGYTASDDIDGNITGKVVEMGVPNLNLEGTYTIKYLIVDTSGNYVSTTRQVTVVPDYEMGITDVKLLSTENGGYEVENNQFLPNQTIMSVGLPNLNSRVTYQVTLKNTSDAYYNLKSMLEASTTNANIKYAISEMAVGNILKANSTKTFKVIFFYTTSTLPSSKEGTITLNYEYAKNQEYDLSGSGNHGTITNVAYNNDGTMTTDGSTSSFINAGLVNYDLGSAVTFGVRVKPHEIKTENSYLLTNTENAGISLYIRSDGEIRAGVYTADAGAVYAYSTILVEVDTWYTIVATYDGSNLKVYVNGTLAVTKAVTGAIVPSTAPITISGNPNAKGVITTPANATFDNAFIFKRVMSAAEIKEGYTGIINMYNKSNLLMYYEFSENKVADLSGNNAAAIVHNAIVNNDGTFTTKDVDDSYVDMGLAQYDFGTEATLALRLKIHSLDNVVEFFGANVQGGGIAIRADADGALDAQFHINGAYVYADSGIAPTLDAWYTLVATYDGTNLKLYINGTLAKTMPATGNIGVSLMPFVLGGQADVGKVTQTIDATFDSALIFDRALTASEISSNYSGVINPLNKNNLLRYYEF